MTVLVVGIRETRGGDRSGPGWNGNTSFRFTIYVQRWNHSRTVCWIAWDMDITVAGRNGLDELMIPPLTFLSWVFLLCFELVPFASFFFRAWPTA